MRSILLSELYEELSKRATSKARVIYEGPKGPICFERSEKLIRGTEGAEIDISCEARCISMTGPKDLVEEPDVDSVAVAHLV